MVHNKYTDWNGTLMQTLYFVLAGCCIWLLSGCESRWWQPFQENSTESLWIVVDSFMYGLNLWIRLTDNWAYNMWNAMKNIYSYTLYVCSINLRIIFENFLCFHTLFYRFLIEKCGKWLTPVSTGVLFTIHCPQFLSILWLSKY